MSTIFRAPSVTTELYKQNHRILTQRNIALYRAAPVNTYASTGGALANTTPTAVSQGTNVLAPIVHTVTKDASNLYHAIVQAPTVLVQDVTQGTNVLLHYLDQAGTSFMAAIQKGINGLVAVVRPLVGQTLTLVAALDMTGNTGNFSLANNLVLTQNQAATLQWAPSLGTSGMWILLNSSLGASPVSGFANQSLSNLTSPTAINQYLLPSTDFIGGGFSLGINTNTNGTLPANNPVSGITGTTTRRWAEVYTGVVSTNSILFGALGDFSNDLISYTPPASPNLGFIKYNVNLNENHSFQVAFTEMFAIYSQQGAVLRGALDVGPFSNSSGASGIGFFTTVTSSSIVSTIFGGQYAKIFSNGIDFTLLGYSNLSPQCTFGDTLIHGQFQVQNQPSHNPIQFNTSNAYVNITNAIGFLFSITAGNAMGIGHPNVIYAGLTLPIKTVVGQSYTVDGAGAYTDIVITMFDNTFTRNLTLPDATANNTGRMLIVKNLGLAFVNIIPVNGQTVDGHTAASPYQLNAQYLSVILVSTGTNWIIAAKV